MNKKILVICSLMALFVLVGCNNQEGVVPVDEPVDEVLEVGFNSDLSGTSWRWIKTEMNDGTVTDAVYPDRFVLNFSSSDDGVSSTTDCNSAVGKYTVENGLLLFEPFATTKMYCEGSQEAQYLGFLTEVASYFIEGDTLYLEISFDSGVMHFERVY
ncbi:hypothetical protein CVV38_04470 [Candidatus Peregrinibacteria bacterium HGW-Peregrinibacteria-1]|jgi:heat shock protein HslJ|nr:MAG: hypothetical protein CVV38_04470 [Candidatus Peregrinibacteria bacterium HGW-Peregrinibacteria-1]